ncbi:MAG: PTS sugar transporter subunit IIB [Deltaproteobacteria bacterium]|nr:PTS sugar transporter subunit IIB [Deltaproteobacteria bacterium]MBW2305334.1 PTS sugar transporter subunit IIB [Deltaproteobacteria bacterium]
MNVVLVRVDDRLIHGQILESWVPFYGAKMLIVASDGAAGNFIQRAAMRLAVPESIGLLVDGVNQLAHEMKRLQIRGDRTILLLESVHDALRMYRGGWSFSRLNLGNQRSCEDGVRMSDSVVLDSRAMEGLEKLSEWGVEITVQSVPTDPLKIWTR